MEKEYTKTFDNVAGKKITQDQIDAIEKQGYLEFGRAPIDKGVRLTLAKREAGLLGENKKKVQVFMLDEMPDSKSINKEMTIEENIEFTNRNGETYVGTYGMANSRKFFCIGETKKSKSKPDESDDESGVSTTKKRKN